MDFSGQKCAALLEAPEESGLVLHISFVDVNLEPRYSRSKQCLWDYLVLTIIGAAAWHANFELLIFNNNLLNLLKCEKTQRKYFINFFSFFWQDRDGREHTSERICGDDQPEPVRSMQSKARVFFAASATSPPDFLRNSSSVKRRRGFKLRYEFLPEGCADFFSPS